MKKILVVEEMAGLSVLAQVNGGMARNTLPF